MIDIKKLVPAAAQSGLRSAAIPAWIDPTKATLTYDYFWDDNWAYEWKLDGERVLAVSKRGKVKLYSRNQIELNSAYPEVVDQLTKLGGDWWLDGEIVAFEGANTSFRKLQERMHIRDAALARRSSTPIYYYVFDCMFAGGYDLRQLPYASRRQILHHLVRPAGPLRLLPIEQGAKPAYFHKICRQGWEGLIVKDLTSTYESKRTASWLKFKCGNAQELAIIGYTEPRGARMDFGALLLGYYERGQLKYAGKVGTGFDTAELDKLYALMKPLEVAVSPLREPIKDKSAHWLKPKLVAQIGFTEWTADNKLRHPRYLGLRDDKAAHEVIKEPV